LETGFPRFLIARRLNAKACPERSRMGRQRHREEIDQKPSSTLAIFASLLPDDSAFFSAWAGKDKPRHYTALQGAIDGGPPPAGLCLITACLSHIASLPLRAQRTQRLSGTDFRRLLATDYRLLPLPRRRRARTSDCALPGPWPGGSSRLLLVTYHFRKSPASKSLGSPLSKRYRTVLVLPPPSWAATPSQFSH
jgi:hypothetical protein